MAEGNRAQNNVSMSRSPRAPLLSMDKAAKEGGLHKLERPMNGNLRQKKKKRPKKRKKGKKKHNLYIHCPYLTVYIHDYKNIFYIVVLEDCGLQC